MSAGLLLHRSSATGEVEVLLVHPGGPFWARRDEGAWSIPKGEYAPGEDPLAAARREFTEELGLAAPEAETVELGQVRQAGGKVVTAYAVPADLDLTGFVSNTFQMEWPPRSGQLRDFPEVDRAEWMTLARARTQLLEGQVPLLDRLVEVLAAEQDPR